MESISLPNSLVGMGNQVFYRCTGLQELNIPSTVWSIGWGITYECRNLASITVASGNPYYNSRNNCNAIIDSRSNKLIAGSLNSTVPSGVTAIGKYAFFGIGVAHLEFPKSLTEVEGYAFYYSGLTSVELPNSVTRVGNYAFFGCENQAGLTLSNSLVSIGNGAFGYCEKSPYVEFPNSLESIGGNAFNYCTGMEEVYFGDCHVTSFDYSTFSNCTSLETVTLPNTLMNSGNFDLTIVDVNGDGQFTISDVSALISRLMSGN